MHTWIKSPDGLTYTVGHYREVPGTTGSTPEWVPMLDFTTQAEADAMVSYLNGGAAPAAPTADKAKK